MQKPVPVLLVAFTSAVLLGAGLPAIAQPKSPPVVQSVLPASNLGLSKGDSKILTLQGSNFIYVSSVEMILEGTPAVPKAVTSPLRAPSGLKASLMGNRTPTSLGILLEAPFTAPDGIYLLRLWAGGEAFDVPREVLRVAVAWARAQILDCVPRQAEVGAIITLKGKYLGDPARPSLSRFLTVVRPPGEFASRRIAAEIVALSPKEAQVRVPDSALYASWTAETPAGPDWGFPSLPFDPLYVRSFPPNLFQPDGTLGSVRFYESQFIFADGIDNSVFLPSSAMRGLGFQDRYVFSFPVYEKPVNLIVGSTKYRVRLNGSNRSTGAESLRSTSLGLTVAGTAITVDIAFESEGVEFVAEYETQDVFSKKITWHKFLNINIDNLALSASMTPQFISLQDVRMLSVTVSSSFTPGFVVLDQNISVDNSPIKDFIKTELEKSLSTYLLSDAFRTSFLAILSRQLQTVFGGCPRLNVIDVSAADDGGMRLTGSTRPVR